MNRPGSSPVWMQLGWTKALYLLWVATLLIWIALGADMTFRSTVQDRSATELMARLHLTAPAYYPAGHPLRHPDSRHPGVAARHTPFHPLHLTRNQGFLPPEVLPSWETQP